MHTYKLIYDFLYYTMHVSWIFFMANHKEWIRLQKKYLNEFLKNLLRGEHTNFLNAFFRNDARSDLV